MSAMTQPYDRTMEGGQVHLSHGGPSLAHAQLFPRQPWRVDFRGRSGDTGSHGAQGRDGSSGGYGGGAGGCAHGNGQPAGRGQDASDARPVEQRSSSTMNAAQWRG